jgi:hypothetical protein
MPKYKAIITTRQGDQITIDLNCREYHANKLNYVFSRTLDRSIYSGCEIVAAGSPFFCANVQNVVTKELKAVEHEKGNT